MVNYEIMFVIDPALEDEKKNAAIDRVKEVISSEGEVGSVDVWGLRKLAYPIQKKNEGYYVVINFQAEPTLPAELDRRLKISDDFIRHMIVCTDEKALEAAKERAERRKNMPASAPAEEKEEAVAETAEAVEEQVAEAAETVETEEEVVAEATEEAAEAVEDAAEEQTLDEETEEVTAE